MFQTLTITTHADEWTHATASFVREMTHHLSKACVYTTSPTAPPTKAPQPKESRSIHHFSCTYRQLSYTYATLLRWYFAIASITSNLPSFSEFLTLHFQFFLPGLGSVHAACVYVFCQPVKSFSLSPSFARFTIQTNMPLLTPTFSPHLSRSLSPLPRIHCPRFLGSIFLCCSFTSRF